ncbi:MAG: hypothetical protein LBS81_01085 [Endomicrobium sp.]|jgi:putative pyruvate formate lyase activating enzyme|nr:hypothetical protein [Endomicrobium sp.]
MMNKCSLCPRKCGVNRNTGEKGLCKAADTIFISTGMIHRGEEPPISAKKKKTDQGQSFFQTAL